MCYLHSRISSQPSVIAWMASRAQLSFVSGYTPAGNVSLAFAGASDFCVAFAVVVVLSVVVVDLAVAAGVVFAAVVLHVLS